MLKVFSNKNGYRILWFCAFKEAALWLALCLMRRQKKTPVLQKTWLFWDTGTSVPLAGRKDATHIELRVCSRFSVLSVHKSVCNLMFSVCMRLWRPLCSAFCSWMSTSTVILISRSAENEMPKCSSGEINIFYLVLY